VKARALCSKYSRREEVLGKQGGHDRTVDRTRICSTYGIALNFAVLSVGVMLGSGQSESRMTEAD
jgi:hypothetical protein